MFIIIFTCIVLLFVTGVACYLAYLLHKEKTVTSAQDKLIDVLADSLAQFIESEITSLDENHRLVVQNRRYKNLRGIMHRRLNEQALTIVNLTASVEALSDELDNRNIENAKRVLGGEEIVEQMLTPGGVTHDRDEWCDRFNCSPAASPFFNDTGEDVEIPIGYYATDRGE